MNIRAILTIDIDAQDFVDAAAHQRRIESLLGDLKAVYPTADLVLRERRLSVRSAPAGSLVRGGSTQPTGRLSTYVD